MIEALVESEGTTLEFVHCNGCKVRLTQEDIDNNDSGWIFAQFEIIYRGDVTRVPIAVCPECDTKEIMVKKAEEMVTENT